MNIAGSGESLDTVILVAQTDTGGTDFLEIQLIHFMPKFILQFTEQPNTTDTLTKATPSLSDRL